MSDEQDAKTCIHGQLARSCDRCEQDAEIARLKAELAHSERYAQNNFNKRIQAESELAGLRASLVSQVEALPQWEPGYDFSRRTRDGVPNLVMVEAGEEGGYVRWSAVLQILKGEQGA